MIDYKMPFGKHKGLTLDKVPPKYLNWLMRELSQSPSNDRIKAEIKQFKKSLKKKISCK